MAKVVSLKGGPVLEGRTPDEKVVKKLEELLEMARTGEIVGVSYCYQYYDDATGGNYIGRVSYSMIGRFEGLKYELLDILGED